MEPGLAIAQQAKSVEEHNLPHMGDAMCLPKEDTLSPNVTTSLFKYEKSHIFRLEASRESIHLVKDRRLESASFTDVSPGPARDAPRE
jgi:hypothetical protein